MKKRENVKLIKLFNWVAILIDAVFLITYTTFMILLFVALKVPEKTTAMENPDSGLKVDLNVAGKIYAYQTVNVLIAVMVVFVIIGISLLVVNIKHQRKLEFYDYHRWEAGNTFVQAISSLLTLNVVSMVLRIAACELTLRHSDEVGIIGFLKNWRVERKAARERRKSYEDHDLTPEELEIKRKVRRQVGLKVLRYTITYIMLILFAIFVLLPFYWMLLTSLKTFQESKEAMPKFFVALQDLQWINVKFVIQQLKFGVYIKNTLIVAIVSTAGTIITTIFASFAFAKISFKGRDTLFSLLLMTMMIPGEIYMITNFITVSKQGFGWIGTEHSTAAGYFATMILPFMTSVFYIFFLRQTFKQVPDALYKAAKVDGCSDLKFLFRVMIPVAGSTIFTITILSILGTWNAFIWPRLITSIDPEVGPKYWLISVALREQSFVLERSGGINEIMFNLQIAASTIVTVPLIIVFLTLRKYIIRGVGRSGTKG